MGGYQGNVTRVSGFDELADEISDEDWDAAWAAYTSGADPLGGATTLRGFVELPIGIVEVRGDDIGLTGVFPAARLGVGEADLTDPDAVLDISGTGPVNWSLTNRRSGMTESGSCDHPEQVTRAVLDALIRLDDDNIYLDIQMVDNGRLGVGLVDVTGDGHSDYDSGPWLGSEWVVLSHDLVVLRPGSRTVTALRLVGSSSGMQHLRVERSTIDVLVFVRSAGREAYVQDGTEVDDLDTVRALFERVRLSKRSMSFEHVELVTAVVREVVAGALSLPVSRADIDDVPFGLTQLARDDQISRLDPTESPRRIWRGRVAELLGPVAHVPSNTAALPEVSGRAVLIGAALDALDRGVLESAADDASGRSRHADRYSRAAETGAVMVMPTRLEFLVGADDRDEFESALLASGLRPVVAPVTNRDLHSTTQRAFATTLQTGAGDHPDDGAVADTLTVVTTTTVGTGVFAGLLDLEDFFRMSVPIRVGSAWVRGLDPIHRFILACIRFSSGAEERPNRDMVVNNMPWSRTAAERVVRLADRCGALTPVRNTVKELWDVVPPLLHPVLEELLD